MEYQLKKKQILTNVQFTNLLSFSLVENKLQRNFRSIVEALMLNQAKTDALNEDHLQVKEQHSRQINKLNDTVQQMAQQLQNIMSQQKNSNNSPSSHSSVKLPSYKEIQKLPSKKIIERPNNGNDDNQNISRIADDMNRKINDAKNDWEQDRDNLLKQIANLKDKVDSVDFLQNELKNLRNDLRNVKQELTNGLKPSHNTLSNRNLSKRQSILNIIPTKASQKVMKQPSKNTLKSIAKDIENKQNTPQEENIQDQEQVSNHQQAVEKQINSLYLELNTLKISFEQLRDLLSDSRKQVYKSNSLLSEVKDDLARQIKTRKSQSEETQKALKDIKMQLMNMETLSNNLPVVIEDKNLRQSVKTAKGSRKQDDDINYKNQLNDKISRLQAMVQNLITQSEFNRLKNDLNDQIQKLSGKVQTLNQNLENTQKKLEDMITQYQANTNSDMSELRNKLNQHQQTIKNESTQNQRKNNILNAKIQQLKKSLQNLREDIQFYQSLMAQNNKNTAKTQPKSHEPSVHKQEQKIISGIDQKAVQNLKKYFSGKLHDLRTNLLSLIRDLQKKLSNKSNGEQQIVKIWDRLNEFNLFMNKKADQDDTKKTFLYLEKKINRLNSVLFKNEDNTEDARIARSNNWYCLSCDKNLQTYQGKIGKHVVWDSMPLKGINKSFVNQQDDKKKGLPQLKK